MEEEVQQKQREIYLLANLVAGFIGCSFSGKRIPKYEELFEQPKEVDASYVREMWLDYANNYNKWRRERGE